MAGSLLPVKMNLWLRPSIAVTCPAAETSTSAALSIQVAVHVTLVAAVAPAAVYVVHTSSPHLCWAPLLQELNVDSLNSEVFVVFQLGTEKLQTPAISSSRGVWGNDTWTLTPTDGSTELEAVVYQKQTLRWAGIAGQT